MRGRNYIIDALPLSIFEEIEQIIKAQKEGMHGTSDSRMHSLHQGKTYFCPELNLKEWKDELLTLEPHQHAPVKGTQELRAALLSHIEKKHAETIDARQLIISSGATHAMSLALRSIIQPDDEVLILSPQWLFANGLIRSCRAKPIEAPVFLHLAKDKNFRFTEMLRKKCSPRTKAIYFNSPNNPTGISLSNEHFRDLLDFAIENDLWIIADNAYENYDFSRNSFIDIGVLTNARERTFSIYTFSKTFAMPGSRIGYSIVPLHMVDSVTKLSLYSIYSVATMAQYAALRALNNSTFLANSHRQKVKQARDQLVHKLNIPCPYPDGGYYAFLDLKRWQIGTTMDFIKKSIERGISLAPGIAFGEHSERYARLCYASIPPEHMEEVTDKLNDLYTEGT